MSRRHARLAALAAVAAATAPSLAATKYWILNNASGSFSDDTKWSTAANSGPANTTHPTDGDTATFVFTDAAIRTLTQNLSLPAPGGLSTLSAVVTGTGVTTITQIPAANLKVDVMSLSGNVTFVNQGTLTVNSLAVATSAATPVPSFTSAGSLTATSLTVGSNNAGVLIHSASSVTTGSLTLLNGGYSMTGAAVSLNVTGNEAITGAPSLPATFTQSVGTHTAGGAFAVGTNAGAVGTYTLTGTGTLNTAAGPLGQDPVIGTGGGSGTFVQTSGTHNVGAGNDGNRTLQVGTSASTGVYNLSGASSTLSIAGNLKIGGFPTGSGLFNQTAGLVTATQSLSVGAPGLTTGANYSLTNGTVSAPVLNNYATFSLTGGTVGTTASVFNNYSSLAIPAATTFNAQLINYGSVSLPTTFTANGGYVSYAPLTLPAAQRIFANTTPFQNESSLNLSGGTIAGSGGFTNNNLAQGFGTLGGTGAFVNNAQFTVTGGPLSLASTSPGANFGSIDLSAGNALRLTGGPLANFGYLNLNSSSVSGTATLSNTGGTVVGPGVIFTPFDNSGTLLLPVGSVNVPAGFTNQATVRLLGPGASLTGGSVTNNGAIQGDGHIASPLTNNGRIEAAGYLTLTTLTASSASVLAVPANSTLQIPSFTNHTNAGLISLTGGTFLHVNQSLTSTGQISGFGTLQFGDLTNNGSLVLANGTSTLTGPVTNNPGHVVEVRFGAALFNSPLTNNGTMNVVSANVTYAGGGTNLPAAPTGLTTDAATGTTSSNGLAGTGDLTVDRSSTLQAAYLRQSSLTNSGTITLRPISQGGAASTLDTLTLLAGSLDLADNSLTVAATPPPTLRTYLRSHFLTSSLADATHSIGYVPTDTGTLVRLTLTGDANLDGTVSADDFALLDRGYQSNGALWYQGDFNYDGQVTPADYLLLDSTYGKQQGGTLSPAFLTQRQSQFGDPYVSSLLAAIPEPSLALSSILYPLSSLLSRRRR